MSLLYLLSYNIGASGGHFGKSLPGSRILAWQVASGVKNALSSVKSPVKSCQV